MASRRHQRPAFDPDPTSIDSCHQTATLLNLCYDFLTTASPATPHASIAYTLRRMWTNSC